MSVLGELILHGLSRDPNRSDYRVQHYELKHEDVQAACRSLEATFPRFQHAIFGRKVLDVGCAAGLETIALSLLGATEVTGIDIRIDLERAREYRRRYAGDAFVEFYQMDGANTRFPNGSFDAIVSLGSFEHFARPFDVLSEMQRLLRPGGRVYATSGVWSGPWGAHMNFFTAVPWVQFLFSEKTVMSVRNRYRDDGAQKYSEVEGGLNKIGVKSFKRIVRRAHLQIDYFKLSPVKGLRLLTKVPFLNEFFTHLITCILRK